MRQLSVALRRTPVEHPAPSRRVTRTHRVVSTVMLFRLVMQVRHPDIERHRAYRGLWEYDPRPHPAGRWLNEA